MNSRKFPPAVAARMLAVRNRLDARFQVLLKTAAPELAATMSPIEIEKILQTIVDDLVTHLDREEATLLDELHDHQPGTWKH